jgi:hypothetical protein
MTQSQISDNALVLAAEDFSRDEFLRLHTFSSNDNRVISKLISHGPVLLQGARGSGKSALMRGAAERLPLSASDTALGVYLSLRHMPLLRSSGRDYERILCTLLIEKLSKILSVSGSGFEADPDLMSVQSALSALSESLQRRIVLMFDDAAHIGRESSLADFFDVFRTLSSSTVSCKATIYPGVTNFGNRFDVFNDANVVDVVRDQRQPGFAELFANVLKIRFPQMALRFRTDKFLLDFASFIGRSVLGNMRSFLFACQRLNDSGDNRLTMGGITKSFLDLAANFYWPLIEEVTPKLGKYVPVVDPAKAVAEAIFKECGEHGRTSVIIHREIVSRLAKAFEILEYVGFLAKREASRGMKSGGRGSRFDVNLCLLLEHLPNARLTLDQYDKWKADDEESIQIHNKGSLLADLNLPTLSDDADLSILGAPISSLKKSTVYPYGLTSIMISKLENAGIITIRDLYDASDEKLDDLWYVGEMRVRHLKETVAQAIWL